MPATIHAFTSSLFMLYFVYGCRCVKVNKMDYLENLRNYAIERNNMYWRAQKEISYRTEINLERTIRHPNTLRFMDRLSQMLIYAVNTCEGYTLWDKVFTAVMYRTIGCYRTLCEITDENGMLRLVDMPELRVRLNRREVHYQGFETPLSYSLGDYQTGDIVAHQVSAVIDSFELSELKGKSLMWISKRIKKRDTSRVLQPNVIMQYALDISYIDELDIKIDECYFGYNVPYSIRAASNKAILEFIEWYKEQFITYPFTLITPPDVLHMAFGYLNSVQRLKDPGLQYLRIRPVERKELLVPLSIKKYHEMLHSKIDG